MTFRAVAVLLVALVGLAGPALADEPNQAGLVVQFDDGRVATRCISFEGESITGAELLTLADLGVVTASSGLGITVCRFEDLGCAYPAEACFCECMSGSKCHYWNYFYRDPGQGEWVYATMGVLLHDIKPGAVEAWVWGDGQTPPAEALTFEAICSPATATAGPTARPATAVLAATAQQTATAARPVTAVPAATATLATTAPGPAEAQATVEEAEATAPPAGTPVPAAPAASSGATAGGQGRSGYWLFAVMLAALIVIGVLVRLRRK